MIAAWMVYCVGIGLAFALVGRAIESALHLTGRQTRWAWCIALAGTLLVPAAAWLVPEGFSRVPVSLPANGAAEPVSAPTVVPAAQPVLAFAQPERPFSLSDLDGPLAWGWGLSSLALLVWLAAAAVRLAALRRRWRASLLDGRHVLVSDNVGPAVVGLWRPRVVVPEWAQRLTECQRDLMLAHEEEHVRAGDPRLLVVGAVALAVAPWNPALWWQLRRLRLAVEMDCDARVLGRAGRAPEYGELLLEVGRRRPVLALGAPALGEPISFLEHRIRRMATALPRWRWVGAAAGLGVATGAIIAACEAPRPVEQEQSSGAAARSVQEVVDSAIADHMRPWIRENIARSYPALLTERSGPPVDVWFGHDSRLQVLRTARTVGTAGSITSDDIRAVFPEFRSGNDAWGTYDQRSLKGLVRDNVRVVWVHLGAPRQMEVRRDEAASGDGAVPGSPVVEESVVDQRPQLLSGPPLQYPELLRHAGIQGRVIVQAIIDTAGRAVPGSVKVIQSTHPGFNESAISWVGRALFRPAHVKGRAVRALINLPIDFMKSRGDQIPDHAEPYFNPTGDYLRGLARKYYPELFARPSSPGTAIVFIFDAQDRVSRHAVGSLEAVDQISCDQVVQRLVPEVRAARLTSSGCATFANRQAVVYWGSLRHR